ncbi:Aerobic glycerol-3-phosphate dehydrogenase [Posidoniimonas polymericola]|uniref:Glycerol-3-phosphate dehydrogenase n=1 Tax=Posidoniimonas polymericola TaxID=2528002 RepID=A0A5C5YTU9_9BACT|nr:glycerol-3-phosphate dehydrogenase/oxidase [Posidoniimonas polymericola]TWT78231.1 Aerobic glycerol-3-phosphate dehydrogenase [Posidoniimonas polymericola]
MSDRATSNPTTTLGDGCFDVLVVGGGIVGAGVARDAALRGLRTALVEQNDFASGTSSRSSRLLHGGIRYLAQGRVGLVFEANSEKGVVGHIAPHLCQPLPFLFPTRKKTDWQRWKLSVGVRLYDLLCGRRRMGRSSTLSVAGMLSRLPGLNDTRLTGGVRYFDALTNDSRLVIDTLRSAANAGATLANYTRLEEANPSDGEWECRLQTAGGETIACRARAVVNATGPWSDQLPQSSTSLRLTKGVHLVVDRSRLPVPEAVVMTEGDRILFAIPWGERVILGTTDTDYDGPIGAPTCDPEDVDYVLEVTNNAFPQAGLTTADVNSTWVGLRPLVAQKNGDPSDISRRHEVTTVHAGWWDVTGGKLTTYRLMAQEAVDAVASRLGASAMGCRTATTALLDESQLHGSGLLPPPVTEEAVQHFCRNEWARHLDDVMVRRSSWIHYEKDAGQVARQVAGWMASELGWSRQRLEDELASMTPPTSMIDFANHPHFLATSDPSEFCRERRQPQAAPSTLE